MTPENTKRAMFKRRVLVMRQKYNMKWTRRETLTFVDRLIACSKTEGIDDVDLRTLVRMYNREIHTCEKVE